MIVPAIGSGTYVFLPFAGNIGRGEWAQLSLALLLHYAMSVSYMLLYTAIIGFSPSIAVLQRVENGMPAGLKRDELVPEWFTDEMLSGARHKNLKDIGLISESGGVLHLEWSGRLIALSFLVFRRVLGLSDVARG